MYTYLLQPIAAHLLWFTCFFDPHFFNKQMVNFKNVAELKHLAHFNVLCEIKQNSAPGDSN